MKPLKLNFGGESKSSLSLFPKDLANLQQTISSCDWIAKQTHVCILFMGRGSPNIEMDEHTFMINRERAVDYLNSLDKVIFSKFWQGTYLMSCISITVRLIWFSIPGICERSIPELGPRKPNQSPDCLCKGLPFPVHAQHVSWTNHSTHLFPMLLVPLKKADAYQINLPNELISMDTSCFHFVIYCYNEYTYQGGKDRYLKFKSWWNINGSGMSR